VALSFTAGLSIGVADANGVLVGAQPTGIAGFQLITSSDRGGSALPPRPRR
jgi:hypothetical protein